MRVLYRRKIYEKLYIKRGGGAIPLKFVFNTFYILYASSWGKIIKFSNKPA